MKRTVDSAPFVLIAIVCIFFYKTLIRGFIPFPGDLLVSEYKPWQTSSYLGYNPGGIPNKAQYPDTIRQLYPWKTLVTESEKQQTLPLWNPYNFSGTPLLANFQSAALYPLSLLYLFLSQPYAWTILVLLQPLLAMLFTYYYARSIGVTAFGALIASVAFGFSSFMTVWLEYNTIGHVLLWLPLILLSVEKMRGWVQLGWLLLYILAHSSSLLAGHPQVYGYVLIFSTIYSFIRFNRRTIIIVGIATVLAIGIGGLQLVPAIELVLQAARSPHSYATLMEKILLQPWHLIMLVVPDFFGNPATRNYWLGDTYIGKVISVGLVSLFFAISALNNRKEPLVRLFIWTALVVLTLITANPISGLIYRLPIPLLSSSSPTLMTFLLTFSLSILAGFGAMTWVKADSKQQLRMMIIPIGTLLTLLWLAILALPHLSSAWLGYITTAKRNLLYSTLIATLASIVFIFAHRTKKLHLLSKFLILAICIGDLFFAFQKFNPFVPPSLVFPDHEVFQFLQTKGDYQRFWGYGTGTIQANIASQYHVYSPDGYDPLYPKRYGAFLYSAKSGKILTSFTNETRSDAVLQPGYGEEDLPSNPYRKHVMDALGVTYILDRVENQSTQKTFPPGQYALLKEFGGWKIFQNTNVAPRAFVTADYQLFQTNEEFEKLFFAPAFNPSRSILLEIKPPIEKQAYLATARATISSYRSNAVTIRTAASAGALLFLSDVYFPGWTASVDNTATPIYRADYTFRAVVIPKGEHTIQFLYRPQSVVYGALVSIVSIVGTIVFLVYAKERFSIT